MFRQLGATIGSLRLAVHPRLSQQEKATDSPDKGHVDAFSDVNDKLKAACKQTVVHAATLCGTFSKLLADMATGKLEVAWGIIDAADMDELARLLRALMIPTLGLSLRGNIFNDLVDPSKHLLQHISQMGHFLNAALDHVSLKLGLVPTPRNRVAGDVEPASLDDEIGQSGFAERFQEALEKFRAGRESRISTWTEKTDALEIKKETTETSFYTREQFSQQQLYILLYIEHLMESCATSALNLIRFPDMKGGTQNHLIFPSDILLSHWNHFIHAPEDPEHTVTHSDRRPQQANNSIEGYFNPIDMDIEHLPPETTWERHSNHFRTLGHMLSSPESVFGLRVTLATLSIAIAAFLEQSQVFFQKNRLVWALVMSTIGMSWTSGQSIFGLFVRLVSRRVAL